MTLLVIDGNSIINRAFYGVRELSTKEGIHTNAIFGFMNILFKLLFIPLLHFIKFYYTIMLSIFLLKYFFILILKSYY